MLKITLTVSVLLLQGCSAIHASAPWSPDASAGHSLLEQIPAWDNAAEKTCGGHLLYEERVRRGLSDRC